MIIPLKWIEQNYGIYREVRARNSGNRLQILETSTYLTKSKSFELFNLSPNKNGTDATLFWTGGEGGHGPDGGDVLARQDLMTNIAKNPSTTIMTPISIDTIKEQLHLYRPNAIVSRAKLTLPPGSAASPTALALLRAVTLTAFSPLRNSIKRTRNTNRHGQSSRKPSK